MTATAPTDTPLDHGFRMPPETAPQERMLMAWPCGVSSGGASWSARRATPRSPTHRRLRAGDHGGARRAAAAELGPCFAGGVDLVDLRSMILDARQRANLCPGCGWPPSRVHFRFNAWGEKFVGWDRDEAAGGVSPAVRRRRLRSAIVLEVARFTHRRAGEARHHRAVPARSEPEPRS